MTDQNLIQTPIFAFHVLVVLGRHRDYFTKNFDPRARVHELLFCFINLLSFKRSCYYRHHSFVKSLMTWLGGSHFCQNPGAIPGNSWWGCAAPFFKYYPTSDKKMSFSTPVFRPSVLNPYPFSDLV